MLKTALLPQSKTTAECPVTLKRNIIQWDMLVSYGGYKLGDFILLSKMKDDQFWEKHDDIFGCGSKTVVFHQTLRQVQRRLLSWFATKDRLGKNCECSMKWSARHWFSTVWCYTLMFCSCILTCNIVQSTYVKVYIRVPTFIRSILHKVACSKLVWLLKSQSVGAIRYFTKVLKWSIGTSIASRTFSKGLCVY